MTAQVSCPRCEVDYLPALTSGTCPVCDAAPPGGLSIAVAKPRMWDDPDGRLLAIVSVATIANVLLLAILALAVLHA